ncbi:unnamed protein product, partial [Amoebophrya sp. A120]|eukprot:GSA120T00003552001.1
MKRVCDGAANLGLRRLSLIIFLFKSAKSGASPFLRKYSRPIAIGDSVEKWMEAILDAMMKPYLSDIACDFAYRPGFSCLTGCIRGILFCYSGAEHLYAGVLILDIKGGFENVKKLHVLRMLHAAGLPRYLLCALWVWLTARQAVICIAGLIGKAFGLPESLGQGTLISPLFFRRCVEAATRASGV